jgi:hypothetical protein
MCGSIYIECTTSRARRHAGRTACPSVVITDGQSVKTIERGGARGFAAHKRVNIAQVQLTLEKLGRAAHAPNLIDPGAGLASLGVYGPGHPDIKVGDEIPVPERIGRSCCLGHT